MENRHSLNEKQRSFLTPFPEKWYLYPFGQIHPLMALLKIVSAQIKNKLPRKQELVFSGNEAEEPNQFSTSESFSTATSSTLRMAQQANQSCHPVIIIANQASLLDQRDGFHPKNRMNPTKKTSPHESRSLFFLETKRGSPISSTLRNRFPQPHLPRCGWPSGRRRSCYHRSQPSK